MLWVGRLGISGGQAREDAPWIGAYPDPGRSEDPSDVYVLLQPTEPGGDEFAGEMKDAIGEAYHKEKASLTGGLLRALRGAHENLRDWNRRSLKEHRVAAGISALAVREHTLCLAQVAPASAAHYHRGETEVIVPLLPDASEPLGLFDDFRPDFRSLELEEGDRFLLLSPALANALTPDEYTAVFTLPEDEALPELYRTAQALPNCAALLVSARPEPTSDPA